MCCVSRHTQVSTLDVACPCLLYASQAESAKQELENMAVLLDESEKERERDKEALLEHLEKEVHLHIISMSAHGGRDALALLTETHTWGIEL